MKPLHLDILYVELMLYVFATYLELSFKDPNLALFYRTWAAWLNRGRLLASMES